MASYLTEQEILDFFQSMNSEFVAADINTMFESTAYDVIKGKVDCEYGEVTKSFLVDGIGTQTIWSLYVPIVAITEIAIIYSNEEETLLTLSGEDRNVWWDVDTGIITTDSRTYVDEIEVNIAIEGYKFPDRANTVRITGTFGETASELVKLLQLLLMLKSYTITQPSKYIIDLVEEKIGRYTYKLSNSGAFTAENQRKGLDGYIDWLFKQIHNVTTLAMETM